MAPAKKKNEYHETVTFKPPSWAVWVVYVILTSAFCRSSNYGEYDSWQ